MSINNRVRDIRSFFQKNQIDFAESISISNGYLAAIELGNRKVNDRLVKLICNEYNVNEDWLKSGEGEMLIVNINNRDDLTQLEKEIIMDYRKLNISQKALFDNLLNEFLDTEE